MEFRELTTEAFSKYHDLVETRRFQFDEPLLPYEYPDSEGIAKRWQEMDFTRELVNKYNHFNLSILRLRIWNEVISCYEDNERYELFAEFILDTLENALGFPYRYRESVAFCATKLCYIHGLEHKLLDRSNILDDHKISIIELKRLSRAFPRCADLFESLENVAAATFKARTSNFRNRHQHQMEARLAFGMQARVLVGFPEDGGVSFTFAEEQPIKVADSIEALRKELPRCKLAFQSYRAVVESLATT